MGACVVTATTTGWHAAGYLDKPKRRGVNRRVIYFGEKSSKNRTDRPVWTKKSPGSLMREPGDAGRPPEAASRKLTEDDFFVEAQPVVQIVEVDGIKDFPFVLDVVGAEDGLAGGLAVVIAGNGGIEFVDGSLIELATFLLENPRFALRICWFFGGDEFGEGFFGDAEAVENHLVVTSADRRIIIMQFTGGAQGRFLPQARQVEDSDWAGDAGTDHGDDFAHGKE